ncbi:GTP cyclohydrolase [Skermanella stibiiresistens SB22]|uniref:GTP cyclohydrolase-2 n=1 Tax=Skermanella stibiiresistens SB22 TaxID=1385369 RepID=W9H789_9PROT|nr:GTP cyclohydrolase II [Skermanella stibiiresistens]EWY40611.1 GTP cyclohydrolase [Skermanella stibiiresistens SB22]
MTSPSLAKLPDDLSQPLDQTALRSVDRAIGDLRRGDPVVVEDLQGDLALALSVEAVTPDALAALKLMAGSSPVLAVTRPRAAAIGLGEHQSPVVTLALGGGFNADTIHELVDPTRRAPQRSVSTLTIEPAELETREGAAVALAKLARLLPSAVVAPIRLPRGVTADGFVAKHDLMLVRARDILDYQVHAARTLTLVGDASVPLANAENTRVLAFRPPDGGVEHLAIVIGEPSGQDGPVLVRMHSECFTGDLLGSLRCDCGDQLRGAIAEISRQGSGVVLYLAQEGRGIGLVNKLRAYQLQDDGFDTVEANEMLGFDADERIYLPAAEMLRQLGFSRVRLLTNNPDKLRQLARCGIEVVDRVAHIFPSNGHNEGYLRTKAERSGHMF